MKSRGGCIGLNFSFRLNILPRALLLPRTAEVTNVEIRPLIGSYLGSKDRVVAVAALYREPR
jgi:hypothetical protein